MRRIPMMIATGLALYALPSAAQTVADAPFRVDTAEATRAALNETEARAPIADAPAEQVESGIAKTAVSLRGSSDDGTVAVTLAAKPNVLGASAWGSGSLTFEAPLDDDTGRGDFVTGSGLTSKFSATAKYTMLVMDTGTLQAGAKRISDLTKAANIACEADFQGSPEGIRIQALPSGPDQRNAYRTALDAACERPTTLHARSANYIKKYVTDLQHVEAAELNRLAGSLVDKLDLWIFNFGASVGYQEFDYFSATDFSALDSKATPYSLSASIGFQPARNAPLFAAGYEYKRNFKDAKKGVQCLPGSGGTSQCRYDIFAGPKREVSQTGFAMMRAKLFTDRPEKKGLRPIIEIKAAYDFEEKRFGVAVPLYFLLDDDDRLKGGVRAEWQEKGTDPEEKQFRFSVFVAKSFGFLDFL